MAIKYKWVIEKVILLPFGALTVFDEDINRPLKEEFLILIMGPLFQIIFVIIHSLFFYNQELIDYSNLILIFNLMPIYPLDGSKLLNILLNKIISFKKSHLITIYVSFLTILFILKVRFNLILFLIISFVFIKVIKEFLMHKNLFNRFLLERFTKNFYFKKGKTIKNMDLKKMKRDYRHTFYNGKRYITEKEILEKRFDFKGKLW